MSSLMRRIFVINQRKKMSYQHGFDVHGLADFIANVMRRTLLTNEDRSQILLVTGYADPVVNSDSDSGLSSTGSDHQDPITDETLLIKALRKYIIGLAGQAPYLQKVCFIVIFGALHIKWERILPFVLTEAAPQHLPIPSQQVVDQAASTSGSSRSSFITGMSSHHQASSSNTVTTSQAGHKRPRDADDNSSTESSASEKTSPQNKRTRVGEQTFQGVSESGLDVEYQVPTSSQRDQEDDVVEVDSEDDVGEEMEDDVVVEADDNFEADTDEIESFGQDDGEGIDMDEENAPNDNNEVDVDDSSNAPNQSSSGLTASSEARGSAAEVIELSPSGQENQQIQTISSGSDAGSTSQANLWRQAQTPSRQQQQQQQQQQQNLVIQQAYEEMTDDSIVPSTPTLYVARRADGFSKAVSSPHPTVPHGSRFPFGDSNAANRTVVPSIEGMDDTRVELNLLDGSGDSGSTSATALAQQNADIVVVDLSDDNSNENKEAGRKQPIAGPSKEGSVPQIMVTDTETEMQRRIEIACRAAYEECLQEGRRIAREEQRQEKEDLKATIKSLQRQIEDVKSKSEK